MSRERDPALDAAQRIADGQPPDLDALEATDPTLARGLRRLALMAHALQPDAPVGRSWGPLQQLEPIGSGSFGEVFRAFDPALDRVVALKLRRNDAAGPMVSGRDFIAEARRLARVRHPNVLAVHGTGYHDDRAGIWTDWIDGETLSARIEHDGAFEPAYALRIARDLAAALRAVHAAGLVHGDIKASNAMLDRSGHALLMDFGAGFERSDEGTHMTTGTPRYLAPEVAAGEPATSAVDIYALGVLLNRVATANYPDSAQPDPRLRPRALRALVARMLAAQPAHRPDAAAVQAELLRIEQAPQRRARQLAVAAVMIGLAAVALVSTLGYRRAEALRLEAETARDQAEAGNAFLTSLLEAPAPELQGRKVTVAELLDAANLRARAATDLAAPVRASLLYTIGASNRALNRLRAGDEALSQALALAQQTPGFDPALELRIRLAQSDIRGRRGKSDEAMQLIDAAATDPRWFADPVASAEIALTRGGNLLLAGELEAAGELITPALRDTPGLSPDTRVSVGWHLGQLYNALGRHADAERVLGETLVEADRQGRGGQIQAIWLRNERANALNQLGRFADAEAEYRKALTASDEAYGPRTRSTIAFGGNLSIAIRDQGRYEEAERMQRDLLALATELEGADSMMALSLRSNLAVTLHEIGRDAEALAEYETLVPAVERVFGTKHAQALIDTFNRIEILNALGRHGEALADGQALRLRMIDFAGPDHPFTLETEDAIGAALTALGRAAEAEPLHRRTVELKTAMLGAQSPYTLLAQEYLARALLALGRRDEARELAQQVLAGREQVMGSQHRRTQQARELLAQLTPA
jgi:tetratricopeptide (TPR) repeat protein